MEGWHYYNAVPFIRNKNLLDLEQGLDPFYRSTRRNGRRKKRSCTLVSAKTKARTAAGKGGRGGKSLLSRPGSGLRLANEKKTKLPRS